MRPFKCGAAMVGSDRLSEMPDEVIVHILSFLPIVDAVRTMLLRRFGNLWTLIPRLSFSYEKFVGAFDNKSSFLSRGEFLELFSLFVRKVLMLHRRHTIDSFQFHLTHENFDDNKVGDDIRMWLRFALGRKAKELHLYVWCDGSWIGYPILPALASQSLVKLALEGCEILPQHQIRMGSLKELHLDNVNVCDEAFQNLISGCPSLQELHITYPMPLETLRFTAPNIVKLVLYYWEVGDGCCVLDCPNLKILELDVDEYVPDVIDVSSVREITFFCTSDYCCWDTGLDDEFLFLLRKLKEAEAFNLCTHASKFLFRLMIKNLDLPRNRWKRIVLHVSHFDEECLLGVSHLAKTLTELEELIIYTESERVPEPKWRLLPVDLSSPCLMPKLKTVTMHGYNNPREGQLQLIKFLLKSAVVLDIFRIIPGKQKLEAVEELDFMNRVSSFPRTSTNARVVFP